jgi:hypothetical protein
MAENKLEGFDDLMSEGQGGVGGELDDILGAETGAGGGGGGGESELDSFFEDLSTIDDLEVMQEEKPKKPAAAAAPPPAVEAPAAPKAAPAPKAEKPKKAPKATKVRGPPGQFMKTVKRLFLLPLLAVKWIILLPLRVLQWLVRFGGRALKRFFLLGVILAVFGGGGYYVYTHYIAGEEDLPWQTAATKLEGVKPMWNRAVAFTKSVWVAAGDFWTRKIKPQLPGWKEISGKLPAWETISHTAQEWWKKAMAYIPSIKTDSFFPKKPEPKVAPKPPPRPAPVVIRPVEPEFVEPPRPHRGPWYGIQVATCFFDSCVSEVRGLLQANRLGNIVTRERSGRKDVLEVASRTVFTDRTAAEDLVERINQENRMEGSAYVQDARGGYRISMGSFPDLERASAVKDYLNQRYYGEAIFEHQLKSVPFKLRTILAGRYPTKLDAERALSGLRLAEPGLDSAAVVQL